jgi:hypothetical protein
MIRRSLLIANAIYQSLTVTILSISSPPTLFLSSHSFVLAAFIFRVISFYSAYFLYFFLSPSSFRCLFPSPLYCFSTSLLFLYFTLVMNEAVPNIIFGLSQPFLIHTVLICNLSDVVVNQTSVQLFNNPL